MAPPATRPDAPATDVTNPLSLDDLAWGAELLAGAFANDPMLLHITDPASRREQTRWFMRVSLEYGLRYGRGYALGDRSALAFYLPPGETSLTLPRMGRAGMLAAPWRLGPAGFSRFMRMADATDREHREHAPARHYYLFGMGVAPGRARQGAGSALLRALLDRFDRDATPCYLETQNRANLPFYERHGFKTVSELPLPGSDVTSWAMLRLPPR